MEVKDYLERIKDLAVKRAGFHCGQEDDGTMFFTNGYKVYVSIIDDATEALFKLEIKDKRIKELEEIINLAVDGIETLSELNEWPEGQMKKDVMAIKECLENTENPQKLISKGNNPKK